MRTSSVPGVPGNKKSGYQSSDEIFAGQYAEAGIQPIKLEDRPIKNAGAEGQPNQNPYPEEQTRSSQAEYTNRLEETEPEQSQGLVPKGSHTLKTRRKLKKQHGKLAPLARLRVTAVNVGIWTWGSFTYVFFQLPFALLSIVLLMVASSALLVSCEQLVLITPVLVLVLLFMPSVAFSGLI